MTLPNASRTACDVKFSEGIKFMKCFCRFFSYSRATNVSVAQSQCQASSAHEKERTFSMIL
jgi:hypothetical protein